jgi:uncharacterized protein YjiS (DUF1127 family)
MSNIRQLHPHGRAVALPIGSTTPNGEVSVPALAGLGIAFVRRLSTALRRRRDAHLLARADDHMLRDIGLTRSQIDGAVRFGRF